MIIGFRKMPGPNIAFKSSFFSFLSLLALRILYVVLQVEEKTSFLFILQFQAKFLYQMNLFIIIS